MTANPPNQTLDAGKARWFVGPGFDLGLLHAPVWLTWAIAFAVPAAWRQAEIPVWVWVGAVLLIDVGHVWSSLYRTYLDPQAREKHGPVLRWVPVACFGLCFTLALHSDGLFWRVLAYIAVYHFIKQQVGVAALYRYRHLQAHANALEKPFAAAGAMAKLDKWAVYAGTVCPVIFWHFSPDKRISWFIPGDFLQLGALAQSAAALPGGTLLVAAVKGAFYAVWLGAPLLWLAAHLRWRRQGYRFPWGKMLWVFGTWINWWLGIVYFDSDLVFTLTNVVAHGVPYYGLIGLYCWRRYRDGGYPQIRLPAPRATAWRMGLAIAFLAPLFMLATAEEYLWNALLYRDYGVFFEALWRYPGEALAEPVWRAVAMAALALPQTTHYVLDGFIWKMNHRNPDLKARLFGT